MKTITKEINLYEFKELSFNAKRYTLAIQAEQMIEEADTHLIDKLVSNYPTGDSIYFNDIIKALLIGNEDYKLECIIAAHILNMTECFIIESVIELIDFNTFDNCYFLEDGTFYSQKEGVSHE